MNTKVSEGVFKVVGSLLAVGAVVFGLTVLNGWDEFLDVTGLREFEPRDVRELASETNINEFFEAAADGSWDTACEQLTPDGLVSLAEIASGRTAPASIDVDELYLRCEEVLEATDKEVDFRDPGDYTVESVQEISAGSIAAQTELGRFTMTEDGHEIVAFPPNEDESK